MKLSDLFTEDSMSEAVTLHKGLGKHASAAFGRLRTTPRPKVARIKRIIKEVFQEVWGDHHDNPKALRRIENYRNSLDQFLPKLLKMSEQDIRKNVKALFRRHA